MFPPETTIMLYVNYNLKKKTPENPADLPGQFLETQVRPIK